MDLSVNLADYETLRALDADNVPTGPSMTEEEINALPVHKYKVSGPLRLVNMVTDPIPQCLSVLVSPAP